MTAELEEEFESSYAEGYEPIVEPKDPYGLRALPFRIGTSDFLNEDNVGLEDLPSDSEDDMAGGVYESDVEVIIWCVYVCVWACPLTLRERSSTLPF